MFQINDNGFLMRYVSLIGVKINKERIRKDCKRSGKESHTSRGCCEASVKNLETLVANITGYTQQQVFINSQGKPSLFHKYLKLILQKLLTNLSKLKTLMYKTFKKFIIKVKSLKASSNKVSSSAVANGGTSRLRQLFYANFATIQHWMLQFILVAANVVVNAIGPKYC
uniref:Uncharacterized protein n=1 Tax=Glossina pallidipes TaxID=7398 RepID=A0A1A9ZLD6_GLOPL